MDPRPHARRLTGRLFLTFALVSLVPVLVLGLVLADTYRSEARRRGLAEARSAATLVARTAVEPALDGGPVGTGLSRAEVASLRRVAALAVAHGDLLRLRLRSVTGRVVFADDDADIGLPGDAEAMVAAGGGMVSKLTHLEADRARGPVGPAAVEVYLPLTGAGGGAPVGVLELYLPYAPIEADVSAGLGSLYRHLAAGLALLWAALFGIAASVGRRLRRQVAANAHLATHDALTGLPNRVLFRERAWQALLPGSTPGGPVAVAIVDVDRFKEVNDTLGHARGDEVLVEIGRRLAAAIAPGDTVCRLGGDEFGIVLRDGATAGAELHRLRSVLHGELVVGDLPLSLEASIGYAVSPTDGEDPDLLVQRADVAMYLAKSRHEGVFRYDPLEDHYDAADLTLVGELAAAIAEEQLVLHYQPKTTLVGGDPGSVEALVRWQHPALGLLSPGRFLPLAEQTDLIHDLTSWVLRRALADIAPLDIGVAVNVSARDIGRRDFPARVLRSLDEAGVAPYRLTLEMTETSILSDPARAVEVLSELANAGIHVSIDDFGQGQTSLSHLSMLPVDELKVDLQFVRDMATNPAHAAIVRSIVDLGHNLQMRVVAEGVESDECLEALRRTGCDVAQGYLLARPMSLVALPAWLASRTPVAREATAPVA